MYWIFEAVTFEMASRYEVINRVPNQDFRKLLFAHQLDLIERLNEKWKERCERGQEQTLSRNPFQDTVQWRPTGR